MVDDKSKRGKQDRAKGSSEQQYEVQYIAEKFDISRAEVRKVIKRVGTSRRKIYAAIREMLE